MQHVTLSVATLARRRTLALAVSARECRYAQGNISSVSLNLGTPKKHDFPR
jgi:hypothetical protein